MYAHIAPKSSLNSLQLKARAQHFEALTDVQGLAKLLGVTENTLRKAAAKQDYLSFHVPKPGGEKRLIQHPASGLKVIQQALNEYLQAVYHGVRPACALSFHLPTNCSRATFISTPCNTPKASGFYWLTSRIFSTPSPRRT